MAKRRKYKRKSHIRKNRYTRNEIARRRLRLSEPYKPQAKKTLGRVKRDTSRTVIVSAPTKKTLGKKQKYITTLLTRPKRSVLDICRRRREREQVIHALGKAGKGGQRQAKWKPESRQKC